MISFSGGRVEEVINQVSYFKRGESGVGRRPEPKQPLGMGDRLQTGIQSWAQVSLARRQDGLRLLPLSELEIMRPSEASAEVRPFLSRGQLVFWSPRQDVPRATETRNWTAYHYKTEFLLKAGPDGSAITVFDGLVIVSNSFGITQVHSGEQAIARQGEPPRLRPGFVVQDAVQWWLDYPAVLDPHDLWPSRNPPKEWRESIDFYRRGNLISAWNTLPAIAGQGLDAPGIAYRAGLDLAFGHPTTAEALLKTLPDDDVGRRALERLRRAVRRTTGDLQNLGEPATASEWLAHSYELQRDRDLKAAREAALRATELSPSFGAAWVRLAELEFSLGRSRLASTAIQRGLELSPKNAAGRTLKGFLLLGENDIRAASDTFDDAIAVDPNHAPAWLGRGLASVRLGDLAEGRQDMITAALLEPGRAILRAYLGKVLAESGEARGAQQELRRARELDRNDPTAWLYAALLNQQLNRVNEAIEDLEASIEQNDQRMVYRSQFLLDQDRAVRGANLANVYNDAGFDVFSVRAATQAVNADYANASAHLFLANSYDALRDPQQITLRYETPWLSEFLVANLLAPVGAGSLSQTVSNNEYSKLFERDGLRVANHTLWTSNGDWLERAAQAGQFGDFEYSADLHYRSEVGQRPNNDLQQLAVSATTKFQAGPKDSVLAQVTGYESSSGDVLQRFDPAEAHLGLRVGEQLSPAAVLGWHHEWRPGAHTLLLVAPWNNQLDYCDPSMTSPFLARDRNGEVLLFSPDASAGVVDYRSRYIGGSTEVQQIWQAGPQILIGGMRYQIGHFNTTATVDVGSLPGTSPDVPPWRVYSVTPDFERFSVYAYDQWAIAEPLLLTAGIAYNRLTQPANFRTAPLQEGELSTDQVAPKVGLTWTPTQHTVLRGFYSKSLSGVAFDQSYRLEPVQIAGFTQTYRGLMPESITGSVAGQELNLWGLGIDRTFPSRTYATFSFESLSSEATRKVGAYERLVDDGGEPTELSIEQDLHFSERTLLVSLGQLAGAHLALTAQYRLSDVDLETQYPGVPTGFVGQSSRERSILHRADFGARWNGPQGFFASWESVWSQQSNLEDASTRNGGDFWQHNVWVGWRFARRRAEVAFGVLNLTDEDYRLYPLNYYPETYRERTFALSGRFAF